MGKHFAEALDTAARTAISSIGALNLLQLRTKGSLE